jgi:hypothetical protein
MKIFVTTFYHDGKSFDGPKIHAENLETAELIAEVDGYIIEGELTDLVQTEKHKRVLH